MKLLPNRKLRRFPRWQLFSLVGLMAFVVWLLLYARQNARNHALFVAVDKGDLTKVERLLQQGADVNLRDDRGSMGAAWDNWQYKTTHLNRWRYNGTSYSEPGRKTLLMAAAATGNMRMLRLLLRFGANPELCDLNGDTALSAGISSKHLSIVAELMDYRAKRGLTAPANAGDLLRDAVYSDQPEILRLLLDRGLNPNARIGGGTVLLEAARTGEEAAVDLLLAHGADINITDEQKTNFLMSAAQGKLSSATQFALAQGINVNARNSEGKTALHFAAGADDITLVQVLLDAGADIEAQDNYGNTSLLDAIGAMNAKVVTLLCRRGANPNHANKNGQTPLIYAQIYSDPATLAALKTSSAKRKP